MRTSEENNATFYKNEMSSFEIVIIKICFSISVLLGLTLLACNKKNNVIQTFTGNLPIVRTNSPSTSPVGQDIITDIRLQLSSLSGSVYFQGFVILATGNRQFRISAKALYKDWNTQIGMPVIWTKDTTVSFKTTTAGIYILNFYNTNKLFKSDTVQVN